MGNLNMMSVFCTSSNRKQFEFLHSFNWEVYMPTCVCCNAAIIEKSNFGTTQKKLF